MYQRDLPLLIGAGDGTDEAVDTILDAGGTGRVVLINSGVTASMQGLLIINGLIADDNSGGGVANHGALTMTDCTVDGNQAAGSISNAGGIHNTPGERRKRPAAPG